MPIPKRRESEDDYVSRCIPIVLEEGTAKDASQAAAICHSMYRESKKAEEDGIFLNRFELLERAKKSMAELGEHALVRKEYRARQTDPGKYKEFRRVNDAFGSGIDVVYGIFVEDGDRKSEVQSVIFDEEKFTKEEAKRWLKEHDFKTGIETTGEEKEAQLDEKPGTGVDMRSGGSIIVGDYETVTGEKPPRKLSDLGEIESIVLPDQLKPRGFGQGPDLKLPKAPEKQKLWGLDDVDLPKGYKTRNYGEMDDEIPKLKQP